MAHTRVGMIGRKLDLSDCGRHWLAKVLLLAMVCILMDLMLVLWVMVT